MHVKGRVCCRTLRQPKAAGSDYAKVCRSPCPVCKQKHDLTSLLLKKRWFWWDACVQGRLPDARSLGQLPVCTSVPKQRAISHQTRCNQADTWAVPLGCAQTHGCRTPGRPFTVLPACVIQKASRYHRLYSSDLLWVLKVRIWKHDLALGGRGLSRPEDFLTQKYL